MKTRFRIMAGLSLFSLLLAGCSIRPDSSKENSSSETSSADTYTITWENYDGTPLEVDDAVEKGTLPTYDGPAPTRPEDEEHTYTWTGGWDPEVVPATANQTYTATYSPEKIKPVYTIDFDLNGGTSSSYHGPVTVEEFAKNVFFFDCVKEGWNFRGWSYNGTKVLDEKGNQAVNPVMAKSMTFVAMYAQTAKMTILTNLEEAGTIKGEGEYPYNSYAEIAAHPNEKYEFSGWYYDDVFISDAEDYKFMIWSEDVTLEARFKLASRLLNIHTNNKNYGLVLLKSVVNHAFRPQYQEYRDCTTPVSIAAYSRTGVRFLGWYDDQNQLIDTEPIYHFEMPNCDYTLEAKWDYFTVSYELSEGENHSSNPTYYTSDMSSLTLYEPTKTGYEFMGWQYKGEYVTEIDPSWSENITLTAVWRALTYSITYGLGGGTNDPANPSAYTIESEDIALLDASRRGYDFCGWYRAADCGERVERIPRGTHGDLTLYAKWVPVVYSIAYHLDGGTNPPSNPETYTIESSFALSAPTKVGYAFKGWSDAEGNPVESIEEGTIGSLELFASWEACAYSITYELGGGTNDPANPSAYTIESEDIALLDASRRGYDFCGWYRAPDCGERVERIPRGTHGDLTLHAKWAPVVYSITYDFNGGVQNNYNPTTYTIESSFVLNNPENPGYVFDGWFDPRGNLMQSIEEGTIGALHLTARWSARSNVLSVKSEDTSKGTVAIISGSGYTGESITVAATPVGDCVFKGWFHDGTQVSDSATYTFTMPTGDHSLVAHFFTKEEEEAEEIRLAKKPILSTDGKTITYGLYPQKNVNDPSLVSALNALTEPETNGWYLYDGEYYAAKYGREGNRFDNGEFIMGGTYWFKCEPILWDVLSNENDSYYILSHLLLEEHFYAWSRGGLIIDGKTIYQNNYEHSDIRAWLNNEFYNSAFAFGNSHIQTTIVDNSASTTESSDNMFVCDDTEDKVFLPSYADYLNPNYGFLADPNRYDEKKLCKTTDWTRATLASVYSDDANNGVYWTRSPFSENPWKVLFVSHSYFSSTETPINLGVRPALYIKIA